MTNLVLLLALTNWQKPVLDFETISIKNNDFVTLPTDIGIPFDLENGEDISSKKYGVMHLENSDNSIPGYINIALNSMRINCDLINGIGNTYLIESIELMVTNSYRINEIDSKKGTWDFSISNGYLDVIKFQIDPDNKKYICLVENKYLYPIEKDKNSRISIGIDVSDKMKNHNSIIEFRFHVNLRDSGLGSKKLTLESDKTYYLAAK